MDSVENCDSYISSPSLQTYRSHVIEANYLQALRNICTIRVLEQHLSFKSSS
jgi:hypothetical protein